MVVAVAAVAAAAAQSLPDNKVPPATEPFPYTRWLGNFCRIVNPCHHTKPLPHLSADHYAAIAFCYSLVQTASLG